MDARGSCCLPKGLRELWEDSADPLVPPAGAKGKQLPGRGWQKPPPSLGLPHPSPGLEMGRATVSKPLGLSLPLGRANGAAEKIADGQESNLTLCGTGCQGEGGSQSEETGSLQSSSCIY